MKYFFLFFIFAFQFSAQVLKADDLNLELRGKGSYRWFFWDVYDAQLWGPKVNDIYAYPLALELKYKRSFKGQDIVKQTLQELAMAGVAPELIQRRIDELKKIIPDVHKGDTLRASFRPNKGLSFSLNSIKELGEIKDEEFARYFLDIWLGEKTSAPHLRDKLLGKIQ